MKKVLFGILALSIGAFAANPGNVASNGVETSSVPVKVIAEIISAPEGLTITDEAGTVLSELLIDHGRMIKGQQSEDSVAFKSFKVKRFANGAEAALDSSSGLDASNKPKKGKLTVALDNNATILKKDGKSDATSKLNSKLSFAGVDAATDGSSSYTVNLDGGGTTGLKEHRGRVTSTIPQTDINATTTLAGYHHNSSERTLTVTYTPTK